MIASVVVVEVVLILPVVPVLQAVVLPLPVRHPVETMEIVNATGTAVTTLPVKIRTMVGVGKIPRAA